jgi:hypothetical protein
VFLIEAIFTEICEAEVASALIDEAVAIGHGAFLVIFELGLLESLPDEFAKACWKHIHFALIGHL